VPRSNAATSKKALARIQRLCCLGIGGEKLVPDLMREITELIPSRVGAFWWVGTNLKIANSYSTSALWLETYFKEFHKTTSETELFRSISETDALYPVSSPVLSLEQYLRVNRRAFLRTDLYNLLWRPFNIQDRLSLRVREAGQRHGLFIYRATGDALYDSSEIKMLESIVGFVAHGMTRTRLEEDIFVDGNDCALFVADRDGTIRHAGVHARLLLMMALEPRLSPTANWSGRCEPASEIVRLCSALAATANGEIRHSPPVLRLLNPWGEFVLRAYWLGPTDGAEQTSHIGLTIERRVSRALALHRQVEKMPLTGREKQFCLLLTHDRSRQNLADAMGVTVGTVITHQSSIYNKLGVHSRAELRAALLPR
jgi:DNA-binding CsgD family transcriptional regulator